MDTYGANCRYYRKILLKDIKENTDKEPYPVCFMTTDKTLNAIMDGLKLALESDEEDEEN